MSRQLSIDVFFDFICPWCLIGKRQLERTVAMLRADFPDIEIDFNWHGVQLLQDLPLKGVPFAEFYQRRLGSPEAVHLRQIQVQQAAAAAGVTVDLARIERMPNTAAAHRLFEHASTLGSAAQRDALLERLFSAYFHYGEDLGDSDTLLRIAGDSGYAIEDIRPVLTRKTGRYIAASGHSGVSGVPYFVFNQALRVSGAQPVDVLEGAIYRALSLTTATDETT